MKQGTKVKFTIEGLGVMTNPNDLKFIGKLGRDFIGTYEGPHDVLPDWHFVTVPARAVEPGNEVCREEMKELGDDHRYWIPVTEDIIEVI